MKSQNYKNNRLAFEWQNESSDSLTSLSDRTQHKPVRFSKCEDFPLHLPVRDCVVHVAIDVAVRTVPKRGEIMKITEKWFFCLRKNAKLFFSSREFQKKDRKIE